MGRYTLMLETDFKDKKVIEIGNKPKVALKKIDLFTTQFPNEQALFEHLNFDEATQSGYRKLYITYNQNKRIKRLPIAYSNKIKLANVSMRDESNVHLEDIYFRQIFNTFLRAIEKQSYRDILLEDTVLNAKLREYMTIWLSDYDRTEFNREKIAFYMSAYKQLRDIIFSFEKYNQQIHKK